TSFCHSSSLHSDFVKKLPFAVLGGWQILQLTAGTGLVVYAVWAGILMSGFHRVPLKLQVRSEESSRAQVSNVMTLLKGRSGGIADLGSGDGRIVLEACRQGFSPAVGYELNLWLVRLAKKQHRSVDLSTYKNVTTFLAPSVLSLLQKKLLAELPEDALIVAGRFPFPDWTVCKVEGEGVDRAWAYHIQELRHRYQSQDKHEKTSIIPFNNPL
uniref:Adenine nucleotide translocase lysine methyltransferase n=1 Tax=Sinocyclocheilus rhinocerous TaxID=307959 RepID=A0A673JZF2_9TELE